MLGLSLLIIAIILFFPPVTVFDKTHAIGYAICHQIPARTFHIDGLPLPLCARCTGIYLGVMVGLVGMALAGRYRVVRLPPFPVLLLLVGFMVVMGVDGVNSYLTFFPMLPHVYEPQNWLRLTTGTFHGLALSIIVFPVFNGSLWPADLTMDKPVVANLRELLPFLAGGVVIILVVLWAPPLLFYPLAVLSTLGVLAMLGIVNTMFALIITRRESCARAWRDLILPVTMGLAASLVMIGGIDWLRAALTRALNLPF